MNKIKNWNKNFNKCPKSKKINKAQQIPKYFKICYLNKKYILRIKLNKYKVSMKRGFMIKNRKINI